MKNLFKAGRIYDAYKILNSPAARGILSKLKTGEKNAGQLAEGTTTPYYLGKLLRIGVISMKQQGTFKIYSENPEGLLKWMTSDDGRFPHLCYLVGKSKTRRAIVNELLKKEEVKFPYSPALSAEIGKLKAAGLVNRRKEGKMVFWSKTEKLENIIAKIENL